MSDQRAYEDPTHPCFACDRPLLPAAHGVCGDCRAALEEWAREIRATMQHKIESYYDAAWLDGWLARQQQRAGLLEKLANV